MDGKLNRSQSEEIAKGYGIQEMSMRNILDGSVQVGTASTSEVPFDGRPCGYGFP
jgi:hypothetical protein